MVTASAGQITIEKKKLWSSHSLENMILLRLFLLLGLSTLLAASPTPKVSGASSSSGFWMANIKRQGTVAFGNATDYQIFRNVHDFGATGMYHPSSEHGPRKLILC